MHGIYRVLSIAMCALALTACGSDTAAEAAGTGAAGTAAAGTGAAGTGAAGTGAAGTGAAGTGAAGTGAVAAVPDDRCEDTTVLMQVVEGCCTDNKCGVINTLQGGICTSIEDAMTAGFPLALTPHACDMPLPDDGSDAGM